MPTSRPPPASLAPPPVTRVAPPPVADSGLGMLDREPPDLSGREGGEEIAEHATDRATQTATTEPGAT